MRPTIGRLVLISVAGIVYPAAVCEVHSDTCISVQRFGRDGGGFHSSVLQADVNGRDTNACPAWDWMPYQKEHSERAAPANDTASA